jgi:hypothetical protein
MGGRCPVLFPCVILTKSVTRVELERQTYVDGSTVREPGTNCVDRIAGLEALLNEAPPLPERKLLWHCAVEKLLDGTREGPNPKVGD